MYLNCSVTVRFFSNGEERVEKCFSSLSILFVTFKRNEKEKEKKNEIKEYTTVALSLFSKVKSEAAAYSIFTK